MNVDSFGDRMKFYEKQYADILTPLLPVLVRLDGKAFHSFTKGLERPYDKRLTDLMVETTKELVNITSAKVGYTQSDEITLLLYSDNYKSQIYFDGKVNKINSVLASHASVFFNRILRYHLPDKKEFMPVFDCRTWVVPNKIEACNVFIWREQDAVRNSIQMAGQSQFSHRQLQNKNCDEIQEMLWKEENINWNDYPSFFKRGTYVFRVKKKVKFTLEELEKLPEQHEARKNPDLEIERNLIEVREIPVLTKIINKAEVLFEGADAIAEGK